MRTRCSGAGRLEAGAPIGWAIVEKLVRAAATLFRQVIYANESGLSSPPSPRGLSASIILLQNSEMKNAFWAFLCGPSRRSPQTGPVVYGSWRIHQLRDFRLNGQAYLRDRGRRFFA